MRLYHADGLSDDGESWPVNALTRMDGGSVPLRVCASFARWIRGSLVGGE
jgi:hypothetical protein